jgi:apolipoprotein N-acyltransferase
MPFIFESCFILSFFYVILGALSFTLCLPPFSFTWLCPLILLPIWFAFEKSTNYRTSFCNGLVYGISLLVFLFYWIPQSVSKLTELNIFFSFILCAVGFILIGAFYGFLFMLIHFLLQKFPWLVPFILPGFEWVCIPAFPISLGYSWRSSIGGVQVADIGGVYFLSSLCCLYSYLIYLGIRKPIWRKWYWSAVLILMLFQYSYGIYRNYSISSSEIKSELKVSILQTGIAPIDKRDNTKETYFAVISQLKNATLESKETELFVLPESIFVPSIICQDDPRLRNLHSLLNRNQALLFGCNTKSEEKYFNSMGFLKGELSEVLFYRKQKLLLLGEYLPFMQYTPTLSDKIASLTHTNQFDAGTENIAFSFKDFNALPFICIESMYGSWIAEVNAKLGDTDLLVNITEDGWFDNSKASKLHLCAISLRAIEMRKPLVRCVNVGYSSYINEWGEEKLLNPQNQATQVVDPFAKYHFVVSVPKRSTFSIYANGGFYYEYIVAFLFIATSMWFVLALWKGRVANR